MSKTTDATVDEDGWLDLPCPVAVKTGLILACPPSWLAAGKAQILDHVWEYDFNGDAGIVESYISYLRRKLDPLTEESLIQTKRGFGYMLKVDAK